MIAGSQARKNHPPSLIVLELQMLPRRNTTEIISSSYQLNIPDDFIHALNRNVTAFIQSAMRVETSRPCAKANRSKGRMLFAALAVTSVSAFHAAQAVP